MEKKLWGHLSRREFIKGGSLLLGSAMIGGISCTLIAGKKKKTSRITIKRVSSNFEREPLIRPFGFKGGYMSDIWQTVAFLESDSGIKKIGLATQNPLWSDAKVFAAHSENGANALMYTITERALEIAKGMSFKTPVDLLDNILEELYDYSKKVTANSKLRKTFALNALVGFDNAAWLLYAQERGIKNFDDMIPDVYKPAFSYRHPEVVSMPTMGYTLPVKEIKDTAKQGYFYMKIKIGQPGTQAEMLEKDKARLSEIHKAIGDMETSRTKNGKYPYYFDANGRYEKKETLLRLLDHAKKIGAFERIAVIEEPFPEHYEKDVSDVEVILASDESSHTDKDALKRIQMGYKSIALKAIAKTLSMTMKIAKVAHDHKVPCFCADLTVNPILVDWNKNVAARLAPFPGVQNAGLMETNGHQNYRNWKEMRNYHPHSRDSWTQTEDGVFKLEKGFYKKSGGIFSPSKHYQDMFKHYDHS